jgi:putative NIF3 family GTP cyclohydrolase 1 type 2
MERRHDSNDVNHPGQISQRFWRPATGRREFITTVAKSTAAALLLNAPLAGNASNPFQRNKSLTVGEIMDAFTGEVSGAPFANTVDTLKAGNRDIEVTGVVTTMFATLEVINKAIAMKANFIIAHEPTYYNHLDETNWLENDDVFRYKSGLLKQHNIAIWRNHDYIHRHQPDGVMSDVVERLGWSANYNPANGIVQSSPMSLKNLIAHAKSKLGIDTVRYIGDLSQNCAKILVMPGAAGGRRQILSMSKEKPDVLVCGEIAEWETAEYVRDARTKGDKLSLIVLGHIASEEPGSAYMARWMQKKFPPIKVTHVPAGNSMSFL